MSRRKPPPRPRRRPEDPDVPRDEPEHELTAGRSPEAPQADLAQERRAGRIAGAAAIAGLFATFAALLIALSALQSGSDGQVSRGGSEAAQYLEFDGNRALAALSVGLRALGLALVMVLAVFLYRAVRDREPGIPRYVLWLGIAAPVLLALTAILGYFAFSDIVSTFVDSGPRTNERARDLADDDGLYRLQQVVQIVALLTFAAWLSVVCAGLMGVGLLPKFLGYYGYGAAVALVLAPFAGDALFLGWLGSVAVMALGWWPGGRPPAWESGRAEPWPAAGAR
jgi:hypothetical protein